MEVTWFPFSRIFNSVINGFNDETFGFQTFIDYTFKYSENKRGSYRDLNSHTPDSKSDAHTTELSELELEWIEIFCVGNILQGGKRGVEDGNELY